TIPSTSNNPEIVSPNVTIGQLNLSATVNLTIDSGRTLTLTGATQTIDGTITSNASNAANVIMGGTTQNIGGSGVFDSANLLNFSVANGSTTTVTAGIQFPNVTINSGGTLV